MNKHLNTITPKRKKGLTQAGIGLLELMLSLAIIAILLIMATRYYQSANNSQRLSQGVDMMMAIKGAVKSYYGTNNATPDKIATLVSEGYLPSSYLDSGTASSTLHTSPWGTAITYTPDAPTFTVEMSGLPDDDTCTALATRLNAALSSGGGESATCSTSTENVTATFSIG